MPLLPAGVVNVQRQRLSTAVGEQLQNLVSESGGKKLPSGSYVVTRTGDSQVTIQQVATGRESALSFTEKLTPAALATAGPRLVFDEVGNFEPSYTEYFTVYVLAEVWVSAQEGYLIHTTKGAHKTRIVTGETTKKQQ